MKFVNKNVIAAFKATGCNVSAACKRCGVSRQQYYEKLRTSKRFKRQIDDAYNEVVDLVESKLLKLVEEGNLHAIKTFLEAKAKDRGYGKQEEKGKINVKELTREELEYAIRTLEE